MLKKETQVYEVGFHIIPTLSESEVKSVFDSVKKTLKEVIAESEPTHMPLAYTIRHSTRKDDGSYDRFDEAYFASFKFVANKSDIADIQKMLQESNKILRFLLTETVEENTRVDTALLNNEAEEETEGETKKEPQERETAEVEEEGDYGIISGEEEVKTTTEAKK